MIPTRSHDASSRAGALSPRAAATDTARQSLALAAVLAAALACVACGPSGQRPAAAGRGAADGAGGDTAGLGDTAGDGAASGDTGHAGDAVAADGAPSFAPVGPVFGVADAAPWGVVAGERHAACVAVADFDGDGLEDVALVPTAQADDGSWKARVDVHLVRPGGKAQVVTSPVNTQLLVPNTGCGVADPDNDGVPDLLLGGTGTVAWLRNDGTGALVDRSPELVPLGFAQDPWTFASGDLNGDGRPDVAVGAGLTYGACEATTCAPAGARRVCASPLPAGAASWEDIAALDNRLWLGATPAEGKLAATTDQSALLDVLPDGQRTELVAADLDHDGHVDLVVGHHDGGHGVARNSGKGGFAPIALASQGRCGGWGVADFDGDGRLDLLMANLGLSALYLAQPPAVDAPGGLTWTDVGAAWGLQAKEGLHTRPLVHDFDHDGRPDVLLMTTQPAGGVAAWKGCGPAPTLEAQADLLLHNEGDHFSRWPLAAGADGPASALRAQAALDLDGDGDLDVVQVRGDGLVRVLRNDMPSAGGVVTFRVAGPTGNRFAVGARVTGFVGGEPFAGQVLGNAGFGGAGVWRVRVATPEGLPLTNVQVHWPAPLHLSRDLGSVPANAGVVNVAPY